VKKGRRAAPRREPTMKRMEIRAKIAAIREELTKLEALL
jgi:hypothetical protein